MSSHRLVVGYRGFSGSKTVFGVRRHGGLGDCEDGTCSAPPWDGGVAPGASPQGDAIPNAGAAPRAPAPRNDASSPAGLTVDIGAAYRSGYAASRGSIVPRALSVGSGSPFDRVSMPASRGSPRFSVPTLPQQSIDWSSSYRGGGVGGGRAALYLAVAAAVGLVWWKKPWRKAADAAFPG